MAALDNASKATDNTVDYVDSQLSTPLLPAVPQGHCWHTDQGLANFFCKGTNSILGFVGHTESLLWLFVIRDNM